MNLTEEQVDFIDLDLKLRGVGLAELRESMLDHICCQIEESDNESFERAYDSALSEFGQKEMIEVQEDIVKYEFNKTWKRRNIILYTIGFLSFFFIIAGTLFKLMHWPGAGIQLIVGVTLLNIGFLPLYFFYRYKRSLLELK